MERKSELQLFLCRLLALLSFPKLHAMTTVGTTFLISNPKVTKCIGGSEQVTGRVSFYIRSLIALRFGVYEGWDILEEIPSGHWQLV